MNGFIKERCNNKSNIINECTVGSLHLLNWVQMSWNNNDKQKSKQILLQNIITS